MQTHRIAMSEFPAAMPIAMLMACVMTAGLFYIMQDLIRFKGEIPELAAPFKITDFVRLIEEAELPPPPPVRPPPEVHPMPDLPIHIAGPDAFGTTDLEFVPPIVGSVGPLQVVAPDGDALPIVAVAPNYPRAALAREIEGYVVVRFTIDELGRVVEPVVVDADPAGVFERSALAAIAKYRYKPKVVDGVAVRVNDVFQRLSYELTR